MHDRTILTLSHYYNVQVTHLKSTVTVLCRKLSGAVLSTENEYLSEVTCVKELRWLKNVTKLSIVVDKAKKCL